MLVRVNFSLKEPCCSKTVLREIALRFPKDGELHGLLARFLTEKNQSDLALSESLRSKHAGNAGSGSKAELAILENAVEAYQKRLSIPSAWRVRQVFRRQRGLPRPVWRD